MNTDLAVHYRDYRRFILNNNLEPVSDDDFKNAAKLYRKELTKTNSCCILM